MSFWDSKIMKDLENGKMPEVPVSIESETIVKLALAILLVILIAIVVSQIFKKFNPA